MRQRRLRLGFPVDLRRVSLQIEGATELVGASLVWGAVTPLGPSTLILQDALHGIAATAHGPGADWMLNQAPRVCGIADVGVDSFDPGQGELRTQWLRFDRPRMIRTDRAWDAVLVAVLGQKVQGKAAGRSLGLMRKRFGTDSPGPVSVRMYPAAATVAKLAPWQLHACGIEHKRAEILIRVAKVAHRLEEATSWEPGELSRRLQTVRGVGPWTSALVCIAACGDPDAVPVGDHNIAHDVCNFLAGEPRGTDDRMLELLEPWRGHRYRVISLISGSQYGAPRRGPRLEFVPVDRIDRGWRHGRITGPYASGH